MNNKSLRSSVQFVINIFLFNVFVFISLQSHTQAQNSNSNELNVMSFNIRYGTANDGENSWQYRKENVMETIKKFNPDILGLQEALAFQIDEIMKHFPNFKLVGLGRDDGKHAGEFSCILYDKTKFSADTTETFWFSETPTIPGSKHWGNNITRICTWARFNSLETKKQLLVYNLHLDHESQPSREKSTELLVAKIKSHKETLPIVVTGDFNSGENNQAIKNVLQSGFLDSYRAINSKNENEGTFNSFNGEMNGEKIDFIFISKEITVKNADIVRDSYNGKFPSDHFPVTAVLRW